MTPAAALANDEEATSPTDAERSRLVYSFEDVYQYGGYHRASLPEDSWIAMREGQRFAVVTTQKCLDDGKWYQSAAINFANYSFLGTDGYRSKITASVQAEYLYHYWGKFYDEHIAAGDDAATAETAARTEAASKVKEEGVRSRIADAVSPWAAHAMAWAVEEGLVSGWDNGAERMRELKPAESVARERAAVVLANAFSAGVLK